MRVAIHQPNFLPWLGYWDKLARVDLFVVLDDVKLVRCHRRSVSLVSRVKIKGAQGVDWLNVPVQKAEHTLICEAKLEPDGWQEPLIRQVEATYHQAPYFWDYWPEIRAVFCQAWSDLADLNCALLATISPMLRLKTPVLRASQLSPTGLSKNDHLLHILQELGATTYLSGEGASRTYLEVSRFIRAGISVEWQGFQHPQYPQLKAPFDPYMSVLDRLFLEGRGL
jgi:hypothetical protein